MASSSIWPGTLQAKGRMPDNCKHQKGPWPLISKESCISKPQRALVLSCLTLLRLHGLHQAPLSMEFSRQEYWSGLPSPSPEDLPNPVTELGSPALQADSLPSEPQWKPQVHSGVHPCWDRFPFYNH